MCPGLFKSFVPSQWTVLLAGYLEAHGISQLDMTGLITLPIIGVQVGLRVVTESREPPSSQGQGADDGFMASNAGVPLCRP